MGGVRCWEAAVFGGGFPHFYGTRRGSVVSGGLFYGNKVSIIKYIYPAAWRFVLYNGGTICSKPKRSYVLARASDAKFETECTANSREGGFART